MLTHRAIESIYREYCEQKGKEQPQCLDTPLPDDLMLSNSAVWQTVSISGHILNVSGRDCCLRVSCDVV